MLTRVPLAAAALLAAWPAWARDVALVIGNENYRRAPDISSAEDVADAGAALEAAGFTLHEGRDLDAAGLRRVLAEFHADAGDADRLVILAAGHFAHAGAQGWLLGTEADKPALGSADAMGLPVATLLAIAAERPGAAIVLLGTEPQPMALGRRLEGGLGAEPAPQGVTVITGDAGTLAEYVTDVLTQPGQSQAALAAQAEGLSVTGFLGDGAPFLPLPDMARTETGTGEQAAWDVVRKLDTIPAYEGFLRQYPSGLHAAEARAAIDAIKAQPLLQAQKTEEALGLSRDQRREIQRNLSLLDVDPRGIDGLFGPGSRRAIAAWQKANRIEATGYLDADQLTRLQAQADRRAAELEAEARARQAELERQDRLYWDQTGAAGDEAGLRAYLKRYPDGLFAELAQERLAIFEEERRRAAEGADRQAWDQAAAADTAEAYRDYLRAFPNGVFAEDAKAALEATESANASEAERAQAEAAENALGLNAFFRQAIEKRLASLGLKPGRVDGTFDEDTRRAIRRYQEARGMEVTGYLTQAAVVRLLAEGL
ncbi:peptidoglycan-binding protein [Albidovulum sediminicola]|uniref:Peptidoglycan-binding protein n=1 Tax=Albidovulum sediminicola TaxID=2984331 RepID=A0ABT2YYX5_9RHOB|nr:peptidoglycan-binding protein [Defluviimonas sp. WL0075]MCV2863962.1 peptidoglycan-binding protein [Defluviimonas sp. WL0075]